ncbi:MAG: hypothetical protein A4E49_01351 [Methanosaeta sp. PtaU1.Bin112]|nr:MAG: hypothetical protein A4E49_01351 [Methanosaeta sp. PtaU1.Bin112]
MEQKFNYLVSPSLCTVKWNLLGISVMAAMFLAMAAVLFFSAEAADYGPGVYYLAPGYPLKYCPNERLYAEKGFFFDEQSSVSGRGEISIKGKFKDRGVDSKGWMKGYGSINLESLRSMDKVGRKVDFSSQSDLVFAGGLLKNSKTTKLPLFEKGIGASVTERFNLSHVDKSESSIIRSANRFNNTMLYSTELAFEGLWNIKNMRGWSINMNKSEQIYSGSFQAQKKIEFDDSSQSPKYFSSS